MKSREDTITEILGWIVAIVMVVVGVFLAMEMLDGAARHNMETDRCVKNAAGYEIEQCR